MYIDKLQQFWTEQERDAVRQNDKKAEELRKEWDEYEALTPEWLEVEQELSDTIRDTRNIRDAVKERYIASFKKKPRNILKDVKEIVTATTQEEFTDELNRRKIEISRNVVGIDAEGTPQIVKDFFTHDWQRYFDEATAETYENFYYFLGERCRYQLEALARYDLDHEEYDKILHAHISQWYKKSTTTQPMAVQNGKIINALAKMGGKKPEKDAFANTAIYSADGVQLFMEEFDKVKRGLSINAHKLLILAMNEFNKINNFEVTPDKGKLSLNNLRLGVHFSFTYYAELRGYDLSNKEQIKELRKSVNRDLTILKKSASLRWEENIKGKNVNFDDMSFFGRVYLKGDVIYMELTQSFGLYLKMLTLTQYSPGLMLIDGRSPNAYAIGVKMCEHYNMDNNVFKGTYNILRVETLLKETNLPTYEKILSQRGSWEAKIKEPFETALDTLTQVGVLSSWAYAGKRGKVLSDAEGYNITNYHEWADLRIKFELKNPKDQTERLERKAHEKKKSEARKARANKKKN